MANVDATRQQILPSAGARPSHVRYLVIATAFLIAYLAINVITNSRQFREFGITLWSPDNGLSLLLLIESTYFAPIVFLGAILSDVFINNVGHSIYIVVASELVLTSGYLVIAIVLRDVFHFDARATTYKNMVAVLAVVPASAVVTGTLYCLVLYLTGAVSATQIYAAASNFWIGDTVGMIVVLPAADGDSRHRFEWALAAVASKQTSRPSLDHRPMHRDVCFDQRREIRRTGICSTCFFFRYFGSA